MASIPQGLIPEEQYQNYEALLNDGVERLRNTKLPNNNKTYGEIISDPELKTLALVQFPNIQEEYFRIYPSTQYPDLYQETQNNATKIIEQRIKPYNNNPYEFNFERDEPELFKRFWIQ